MRNLAELEGMLATDWDYTYQDVKEEKVYVHSYRHDTLLHGKLHMSKETNMNRYEFITYHKKKGLKITIFSTREIKTGGKKHGVN